MKDIEKMLKEMKTEIDELEIPEELETRMHHALRNPRSVKLPRKRWRVKVIALLMAAVFLGYHGDTLAYYGKILMGYDQVMDGTLKQLNELGKGQTIEKSYTFQNGVTITLDGVMLDDNQLLIFYSIKDPKGNVDQVNLGAVASMEGMLGTYNMKYGYGQKNEEKTEIKWMAAFETPYFFEKKLKWKISLQEDGKTEVGEIDFTLDRNKAMGHTLKKELKAKIKVDEGSISFDSIVASPTSTVVKGTIQNILELAMDQISGERFRPTGIEVKLIANGEELAEQGSEMSTDRKGMKFAHRYDPLPPDLEQLQLQLVSFGADHDVHQKRKLKKDDMKQSMEILGQNIVIEKVFEKNGDTFVTITTEESVTLTRVYLIMDSKTVELQETLSDTYDKKADGTITHTRTLHFPGTGSDLQLDIQRMKYNKNYDQIIDIPVR